MAMREPLYPARVEALLDELCGVLGICLDAERKRALVADPPAEVEAFARAAMRAAGLDPEDPKWARLRARAGEIVARHFDEFRRNTGAAG